MARRKRRGDRLRKTVFEVADRLKEQMIPGLTVEEIEREFVDEVGRRQVQVTRRNNTLLTFDGKPVETFLADVVLEGRVMVEIKRLERVSSADLYRFANYLKSSEMDEGFIISLSGERLDCCYMNVSEN